jgi:hypothetical protein
MPKYDIVRDHLLMNDTINRDIITVFREEQQLLKV